MISDAMMNSAEDASELKSVKLPLMMGAVLRRSAALIESPLISIVFPSTFDTTGITDSRKRYFNKKLVLKPRYAPGVEPATIKQLPIVE